MLALAHSLFVLQFFLVCTKVTASPVRSLWDTLIQQGNHKIFEWFPGRNASRPDYDYASKYLRYTAFGDSWTSGVNYGPPSQELEYNYPNQSEICRCRRVNEAWPVQLQNIVNNATDGKSLPKWTGGRAMDLDFVACFASYFDDIPGQIARMNQTYVPEFATLTIGGNPGGFPDLLYNCIFWPEQSKNYGPEYPDPEGECWKSVQKAKETVASQWFLEGILRSIALILTEPRIRLNPNFKLYVLSYAELFNADDDACDEQSFGVWSGKKPKLTKALRKEMNGIINHGRQLYDLILNSPLFGDTVTYVDINHLFEAHRFCEKTANGTLEQQNEKSWLYNLEWPKCIPITDEEEQDRMKSEAAANGTSEHDEAWPNFCRKCGAMVDYGEFARPFHPKPIAHEAISHFLINRLSQTLGSPSTQPYADILGLHGDM